ncbi:hypothetical protein FRC09_014210 [Ceratobasidium sp. 395]|nr:hypothetical protein FRC09_014210 [Ceratobasidium sp. 395]
MSAQGEFSFLQMESQTCYTGPEDIITEKALESIAKSKSIVDVNSLDTLRPVWPQRGRWGEEIVALMKDLMPRAEETRRLAEEEKKQRTQENKAAAKRTKEIAKRAQKEAEARIRETEDEAREAAVIEARRRVDEVTSQAQAASQIRAASLPSYRPGSQPAFYPPQPQSVPVAGPSSVVQRPFAPRLASPQPRSEATINHQAPTHTPGSSSQPVQLAPERTGCSLSVASPRRATGGAPGWRNTVKTGHISATPHEQHQNSKYLPYSTARYVTPDLQTPRNAGAGLLPTPPASLPLEHPATPPAGLDVRFSRSAAMSLTNSR